jgi:DNA polymerase-1
MKKLILIDTHAIVHRAYHALPPLTDPNGEPVNAVYGFSSILIRILRELKPDYFAAAADAPGPTFRHAAYERYKAHRPETPEDLASQFPRVRDVIGAFGIPIFMEEGYEADDIIGTIAEKFKQEKDLEIIVVTGDLDMLQLVRPRLKVYAMKKGITETLLYDQKAVGERFGIAPSQFLDFKALKGDPSDNIPGVKGIGEKTAADLLRNFGSIEEIYRALNAKKKSGKISPATRAKLEAGKEDAFASRELARIRTDIPIAVSLSDCEQHRRASEGPRRVFERLGFTSLIKRLGNGSGGSAPDADPKAGPASGAVRNNDTVFPFSVSDSPPARVPELKREEEFEECAGKSRSADFGLLRDENGLLMVRRTEGRANVFRIAPRLLASAVLKNFFGETKKSFSVHDGKSIIKLFLQRDVPIPKISFDTMLADYLLGLPNRDFSFRAVASRALFRLVSPHLGEEAAHFFDVKEILEKKLDEKSAKLLFEVELPLSPVLSLMEERGILVDRKLLDFLSRDAEGKLARLIEDIHTLAGGPFNINSPPQISEVLFEKLGIRNAGLKKTEKGGAISTGASELEKIKDRHPIVGKILEYRELAKLKTTYIDALPRLIDAKTGRIHTTFHQTGAATGRLSSSDPNLQNIPVISAYGREIRKAFIAPEGFLLASFDYSQIELRVAAHMAGDEKMIRAFQEGLDIHAMTAAEIYHIPFVKVTPELRRAAKTLNFGILYGMGSSALAESAGMPREDARTFIEEYFRDFSGIREYIERTKRFAEERGYVETLFGRRRFIPEILSSSFRNKREAERMAVNHPIQGTATGDIIKMAMIRVDEWIRTTHMEENVRMLLQVHDELLFEIKEDVFPRAAREIKNLMEQTVELRVPLLVDAKAGHNWGEEKKLAFP